MVAMFDASLGSTRTPGVDAPAPDEVIVIHPEPVLLGSVIGPVNTAPACKTISGAQAARFDRRLQIPPGININNLPYDRRRRRIHEDSRQMKQKS